jgi:hypothetical protein
MIDALKADPARWFEINRLGTAKVTAQAPEAQLQSSVSSVR